jgi:hypothetical protein
MDAIKTCQFCGEQILAVAIKCKHCGSDLRAPEVASSSPARSTDLGWMLLGLPIAGAILLWFWVANMALIQGPGSAAELIVVGVVLGTAALAAIEAGKLGMKTDKAAGSYSPGQWAALLALLWVIGYPAYLFKRRHFGKTNLMVWGIVVAVIFIGSAGIILGAVNAKVGEIQANLAAIQSSTASSSAPSPRAINEAPPSVAEQPPPAIAPSREVARTKIAAYCKDLSANGGGGYEIEETCRKLELEAWTHLALGNEFANVDATMLRQCASSPMNDSFQIEETCLKQEASAKAAIGN